MMGISDKLARLLRLRQAVGSSYFFVHIPDEESSNPSSDIQEVDMGDTKLWTVSTDRWKDLPLEDNIDNASALIFIDLEDLNSDVAIAKYLESIAARLHGKEK